MAGLARRIWRTGASVAAPADGIRVDQGRRSPRVCAAGLATEAEIALEIDPDPFPAWRGFVFGNDRERPDLAPIEASAPRTDASGRAEICCSVPRRVLDGTTSAGYAQ